METRFEPLHEPFSTADAGYPMIVLERGCLQIAFKDWREKQVTLLFHDVVAFSWEDGDAAGVADHRDDYCYVVHNSPWLARHRDAGTVMPTEKHRHFKLCFNMAGVLEVLASKLDVAGESGDARYDGEK